jgi:hypothetical protein
LINISSIISSRQSDAFEYGPTGLELAASTRESLPHRPDRGPARGIAPKNVAR